MNPSLMLLMILLKEDHGGSGGMVKGGTNIQNNSK